MTTKFFKYGGIAASVVLIAFGIGTLVTGFAGRGTVQDSLKLEQITGSDDMTPALTAAAVKGTEVEGTALPTCSVAGVKIDTGARAKCFAEYMRIHTLEATQGRTYSEMGQYLTASGEETSDKAAAAIDPKTENPVPNAARNIWVTETALTTALNTSFFADSVAKFAIVMGVALLLVGIGLLVLALRWIREPVATSHATPKAPTVPVPA
jgi:hypothetical protein